MWCGAIGLVPWDEPIETGLEGTAIEIYPPGFKRAEAC